MKKMTNFKKIFAVSLSILFLFLSGCGGGQSAVQQETHELVEYENQNESPQNGGVLRLALISAKTLDPILASCENNLYVLKLIYDGLFQNTPNNLPEPVLCEDYTISPDGLSYEFIIKSGVSFHDGTPLTAADVDATISHIQSAGGLYENRLINVVSHHAQGMKLYLTLNQPVINFAALLDFPILARKDLGTAAADFVPNGTGRYKVQSYKRSKELYLSVNQNYHKSFSPHISEIQIQLVKNSETAVSMLENLQIDLLPSGVINLYEYTPKRKLSLAEYPSGRFTYLGINNQKPALLSPLTRTAMAVSINKTSLLESCTVKYAETADLPLPSASFWNDISLPETEYNHEYAAALLSEDGWQDTDGDGILEQEIYGETEKLLLTILVNKENQTRLKLAEELQRYFREVGIASQVAAVSYNEYVARIEKGNFDVFIAGTDLSENFDLSFMLRTDRNVCGVSVEELDQTFNALALLEGSSQKQALFYEICEVLKNETPCIGLYFEHNVLIFDERLKGNITPSESDIFYGIEHWFLKN